MVTSLLLKAALSFTLFAASLVGLIHAQSYDDTQVRDLLLPPDTCPMPCFMGIRPGVTTYDEVVVILDAHPWVKRFENYGDGAINIVQWTGVQPTYIDTSRPVYMRFSNAGVVNDIDIITTLDAGYVHLLLGEPSAVQLGILGGAAPTIYVTNIYSQLFLNLTTRVDCPLDYKRFLESPVRIRFNSVSRETSVPVAWERNFQAWQTSWCR
jgi:hypothetical protein